MFFAPTPQLSDEDRERGLRHLVREAGYSNASTAVTSGVILTAFALHLGASNTTIGLLAAVTFWVQLLQAPGVLLVEHFRTRKRIAILGAFFARCALLAMAVLALLPNAGAVTLSALVVLQFLFCGIATFGGCAWNAWVRDLAPEQRLGQIFARRTINATVVGLVASLAAAFALDRAPAGSELRPIAFAGLYVAAFIAGVLSCRELAKTPEPQMPAPAERVKLLPLLRAPLRDQNFRRLIIFLASWQFAVNLATPFFTVFFVKQLGLDITFVVILGVVSQATNVLALRSWGLLSDRFANKSVLAVAAPIFILCIAAMVGASQISERPLVMAYLVALHALMGLATAGVTLSSGNIAMKLSPRGSATAYIAANALISSAAAGAAPLLGGMFADFFAARRLEILLRWTSPGDVLTLMPLRISSWDFYFLLAFVLGLYALHRLSLVTEAGEVDSKAMVGEVLAQARREVRNLSPIAGLKLLTDVPAAILRDERVQRRLLRARESQAARDAEKARRGGRRVKKAG
ncbi:MFS transporter [Caulobacter hibisci]|uniref:MFS transporter n=1 Tax=Caulobacter hibisci TaxID=2035993 RepID=A0ABS0SY36_9CAUL|nr:MFS transporter [Caulobacter hibisci]MBI1684518.1 MFS transporter [Caulobacter hibisci]